MNSRDPLTQKTLLACFAHPDDETFGVGGTLARYAREGVAVHLACATRGEVGMVKPEHLQGFATIGELRWAELACAAQALGLASITYLGYRDSGMEGSPDNHHPEALAAAPVEAVAGKIVRLIRELKPQVVMTFDPVGVYGHPDHIAIHKATVLAFEAAGDPQQWPEAGPTFAPARLYFYTIPWNALRWMLRLMPLLGQDPTKVGTNRDIDLMRMAENRFRVTTVIGTGRYREIQRQAMACHRSQLTGEEGQPWLLKLASRLEGYWQVYTRAHPPFRGGRRERGLFGDL